MNSLKTLTLTDIIPSLPNDELQQVFECISRTRKQHIIQGVKDMFHRWDTGNKYDDIINCICDIAVMNSCDGDEYTWCIHDERLYTLEFTFRDDMECCIEEIRIFNFTDSVVFNYDGTRSFVK